MKKNMNKELVIFGVVLLIGTTFSEETNKKSSDKVSILRRESEITKKPFEKDEKLNTASQNFLPGYNNNGGGFNSGFGQNGFNTGFGGASNGFSSNGFGNGFSGNGFSGNGFGTNGFNGGVNSGIYPQGAYASSGAYNGLNYNQNGLAYPFASSQGNGFGFQGQGLYSGSQLGNSGVIQGQGFPGGFNSALGGPGGRFQQFNAFGMPFSTQGAIGIGNYQASGFPGTFQGQLADRRGNQYIGNGISVGNTIDVGQRGNGRPGDGSAAPPSGRTTNQPRSRFVAGGQGGQTFGLNYADQPYNILGGGTFGGGPGYPGGIPGGIYRGQNSGVFNQQVDYLNGPNSRYSPSGNRYFQGANSQGVQRIHRFVAPDSNRN